mgnify:CR=1 FL=1
MKEAIAILTGGGPAPGMNTVVGSVAKTFLRKGYRVIGLHEGYTGLFNPSPRTVDIDYPMADGIFNQGGSFLQMSRFKPKDSDFENNFNLKFFTDNNIKLLVTVGGDDTASTANRIAKFLEAKKYPIANIHVPKTIDNDLFGTDHCPGFASAAKYIATSCMEVYQDARVYDTGMVCIIEIMGRHAGWLAGSAALATYAGAGPDLVYLPEVPFRMEEFWQDVDRIYRQNGSCMVAVSEGVQYADGRFVAESGDRDVFGHTQLGGLGAMLAESVKRQTGAKVRSIELSLLQRCASHVASKTDIDEAYMAGKAAVEAAVSGQTDKMVAFERITENGIYSCKTKLIGLGEVANVEKLVPREWINARGNGVEQPFIDYVLPLIQGETAMQKEYSLPRFAKLRKVPAKPKQR